jgi:hypothetical protein
MGDDNTSKQVSKQNLNAMLKINTKLEETGSLNEQESLSRKWGVEKWNHVIYNRDHKKDSGYRCEVVKNVNKHSILSKMGNWNFDIFQISRNPNLSSNQQNLTKIFEKPWSNAEKDKKQDLDKDKIKKKF